MKNTGGCVDEIISGNLIKNLEITYFIAESAEEAVNKAFELCKSI